MFTKNYEKLVTEHALCMVFFTENHVFTEFSEAELLDLSLDDDE